MVWIYIAATIFGGSFLIPMVLGGLASDFDADVGGDTGGGLDLGSDLEVEVDADIEFDTGTEIEVSDATISDGGGIASGGDIASGGAFDGAFGAIFASIVSFRTVVFFLAFFGVAGLVFGWLGYGGTATFASATLVGFIAAAINATLFGLIRHSQTNSQISDQTLEGRWAKVVLPMTLQQRGRIRIDLSGQPQYLVAKPLDDGSTQQFDVGTSVVVVKVEKGTALVSSVQELDSGEES